MNDTSDTIVTADLLTREQLEHRQLVKKLVHKSGSVWSKTDEEVLVLWKLEYVNEDPGH